MYRTHNVSPTHGSMLKLQPNINLVQFARTEELHSSPPKFRKSWWKGVNQAQNRKNWTSTEIKKKVKPSCASAIHLNKEGTGYRDGTEPGAVTGSQKAQPKKELSQNMNIYILMVWKIASWIWKYETWQLIVTGAKTSGNDSRRCNTSWKEGKKERKKPSAVVRER